MPRKRPLPKPRTAFATESTPLARSAHRLSNDLTRRLGLLSAVRIPTERETRAPDVGLGRAVKQA